MRCCKLLSMVIYLAGEVDEEARLDEMSPRQIVSELDKHVVGQRNAKRAVAIALRNRVTASEAAARNGRRCHAQEHHHDRFDRRRQNRDCAAAGDGCRILRS